METGEGESRTNIRKVLQLIYVCFICVLIGAMITLIVISERNKKMFFVLGTLMLIISVIGFLFVVIKLEQKQKKRNSIDQRIIDAMTSMFRLNLLLDLEHRKTYTIYADSDLESIINEKHTLSELFVKFCHKYVSEDQLEEVMKFADINTIPERLMEEDYVSCEYRSNVRGWSRGIFLAMERDKTGRVTKVLYIIQKLDMERVVEMERLYENASAASAAKTTFLSKMSHDIRTPMNVVVGMIQVAKKYIDNPEKMADCLNKIDRAGVHLQTLVNDILDISAIEAGRLKISARETDIRQLINNIIITIESAATNRALLFETDSDKLIHSFLIVDSLRLNQIYINLLSNAVKFTAPGGNIRFSLWEEATDDKDYIMLCASVSDTGIGMSEEFMANMYDEFARAVDTRVNTIQGTGLGLAIVKHLVEAMDGSIDVKSVVNEGSIFTVRIKAGLGNVLKENNLCDKIKDYEEACRGIRLLIAEDNAMNYEMEKELLSFYGIVVEHAVNGENAYDMYREKNGDYYDAILMDLQMPVMNGFEATKKIREYESEKNVRIPIIAMTANAFVDDIDECIRVGMDAHIAKPIKLENLLDTLIEKIKDW